MTIIKSIISLSSVSKSSSSSIHNYYGTSNGQGLNVNSGWCFGGIIDWFKSGRGTIYYHHKSEETIIIGGGYSSSVVGGLRI